MQPSSHLRLARSVALRGISVHRHASTKAQEKRQSTEDGAGDFRPPWVYFGSRFLTYTAIPLTLLYCALLADWGEREHIFMPLRRWVTKHKESMLSLTPEEAALVQGNSGQAPDSSSSASQKHS